MKASSIEMGIEKGEAVVGYTGFYSLTLLMLLSPFLILH